MNRVRLLAAVSASLSVGLLVLLWGDGTEVPSWSEFAFWIGLLLVAEALPVTLGFQSQISMGFPVALAVALLFQPSVAMVMMGLGNFDLRELRREIPFSHSVFNRSQTMLAAAAASSVARVGGVNADGFPSGILWIALAGACYVLINLGLVAIALSASRSVSLQLALSKLIPRPAAGFWIAQALLGTLGVATAAAYLDVTFFVAAFLIPLLFARLGLLGARAQQELSERLRQQQAALLKATEQIFNEREDERKRIAGEIHDGSLQMLAAASYNVGNAGAFLDAGKPDEAAQLLESSRKAIEQSMAALRDSLVDLRRSSVEAGGLLETIRVFVDQVSMLWGTEVDFDGEIKHEPPVPIALAGFQILQEGLTNALKHANSSSISVRVADIDNMVHIIVEDGGPGFNVEAEVSADHVGMRLMEERAALVGGSIEFRSVPDGGTRLEAKLPGGMAE
jgi:signal transduction histidine kinase